MITKSNDGRHCQGCEGITKSNLSKDYIELIRMCQVLLDLSKEVEYDLKYHYFALKIDSFLEKKSLMKNPYRNREREERSG
jgi:hypothetical protein